MTLALVCLVCVAVLAGALYFLWYWEPKTLEEEKRQHALVDVRVGDTIEVELTTDSDHEGLI